MLTPPTSLAAAIESEDVNAVKLQLAHGAAINERDSNGNSALIKAVNKGNIDIMKLLLEYPGIEVNGVDNYNRTALTYALFLEKEAISRLLIEHGADIKHINGDNTYPLLIAMQNDQINMIKLLLEYKELDLVKPVNNWTAWSRAFECHQQEIIPLFIQHAVDQGLLPATLSLEDVYFLWQTCKWAANKLSIIPNTHLSNNLFAFEREGLIPGSIFEKNKNPIYLALIKEYMASDEYIQHVNENIKTKAVFSHIEEMVENYQHALAPELVASFNESKAICFPSGWAGHAVWISLYTHEEKTYLIIGNRGEGVKKDALGNSFGTSIYQLPYGITIEDFLQQVGNWGTLTQQKFEDIIENLWPWEIGHFKDKGQKRGTCPVSSFKAMIKGVCALQLQIARSGANLGDITLEVKEEAYQMYHGFAEQSRNAEIDKIIKLLKEHPLDPLYPENNFYQETLLCLLYDYIYCHFKEHQQVKDIFRIQRILNETEICNLTKEQRGKIGIDENILTAAQSWVNDPHTKQAALIAAVKNQHQDAVIRLLNDKVDITITDKNGATLLMLAVATRNKAMITLLLDSGAQINSGSAKANTGVMALAQNLGDKDIIKLLQTYQKQQRAQSSISMSNKENADILPFIGLQIHNPKNQNEKTPVSNDNKVLQKRNK